MKIFFDQGTPAPLRRHLVGHAVDTAHEQGWSGLANGDLLDAAEQAGYQLLITTDQNLRYQQQLAGRQIAILVLLSTSWPRIRARVPNERSRTLQRWISTKVFVANRSFVSFTFAKSDFPVAVVACWKRRADARMRAAACHAHGV